MGLQHQGRELLPAFLFYPPKRAIAINKKYRVIKALAKNLILCYHYINNVTQGTTQWQLLSLKPQI